MSIPHTHTRELKSRSETSFTLLQFRCTRQCRRGIRRLMSTRYFVRSCYRVISILIESRFAVSPNAECPSRHEKLSYFRSDRPRYRILYGNGSCKAFCQAGLIEETHLYMSSYMPQIGKKKKIQNVSDLRRIHFPIHLRITFFSAKIQCSQ